MSTYEIEETIPTVQYGNIHLIVKGEEHGDVSANFFKLKKAFKLEHDKQPPFYSHEKKEK